MTMASVASSWRCPRPLGEQTKKKKSSSKIRTSMGMRMKQMWHGDLSFWNNMQCVFVLWLANCKYQPLVTVWKAMLKAWCYTAGNLPRLETLCEADESQGRPTFVWFVFQMNIFWLTSRSHKKMNFSYCSLGFRKHTEFIPSLKGKSSLIAYVSLWVLYWFFFTNCLWICFCFWLHVNSVSVLFSIYTFLSALQWRKPVWYRQKVFFFFVLAQWGIRWCQTC